MEGYNNKMGRPRKHNKKLTRTAALYEDTLKALAMYQSRDNSTADTVERMLKMYESLKKEVIELRYENEELKKYVKLYDKAYKDASGGFYPGTPISILRVLNLKANVMVQSQYSRQTPNYIGRNLYYKLPKSKRIVDYSPLLSMTGPIADLIMDD